MLVLLLHFKHQLQKGNMVHARDKEGSHVPVYEMGHVTRKPVFGVSDKASFKPLSSAIETS